MFNYEEMKLLSNEKEFFIVLKDGSQVPFTNLVKKGRYYRGTNSINDIPVKVLVEDVGGYFYINDEDVESNNMYKQLHNHYQTVIDMYTAENLSTDSRYFYADLPVSQKVICGILDKPWDQIELDELKDIWFKKITESCANFNSYIEKELEQQQDDKDNNYKQELLTIQNSLNEFKDKKFLDALSTKEELIRFWPRVLQPSPGFVSLEELPQAPATTA